MANDRQITFAPEDTLALINARLKEDPNLTFRVKVFKRQRVTGILDHVATLGGCAPIHLANPEGWIPDLCGGGSFVMSVYSLDQPTIAIGGHIPYSHRGLDRDVNMSVTSRPSWEGPPVLEFPKPTDGIAYPEPTSTSVIPGGLFSGGPGIQLPHAQAPQTNVPGQGGSGPSFNTNHESVWLKQMEDRFALREREILAAEQKMRAEADAQKTALREERLRNEFEAKQRDLENQIKAAAAATANAKPAFNLEGVIAALAPVVTGMMASADATRAAMLKAQQDAAAQQQLLLAKLMDKPAIGPEIQLMMEMMKAKGSENKEAIEAMGIINKTTLSMLSTVADMNLGGQPENPMMQAVKEAIKAFRIMQSGAQKQAAPPPMYPQPQALPQGFHQQAQQLPQRAPPPPSGAVAQGPQAFAGLPPKPQAPGAQPTPEQLTLIQKIVVMIKTYQPPTEVARTFLLNLRDPSIFQAMQASGMDTDTLVLNLLGDWVTAAPQNMAYLEALKAEVDRLGAEAGIFDDDEEAEEVPQNGAVAAEVAADALDQEDEEDAEYDED